MKENPLPRSSSKAPLFLMEQLLVILFFALAAAVCAQIFVTAQSINDHSSQLNYGLIAAQNGAESFKAAGGRLEETAELLDATLETDGNGVKIYLPYDLNWLPCEKEAAAYYMELTLCEIAPAADLAQAQIRVFSVKEAAEPIYELTVVAREVAP